MQKVRVEVDRYRVYGALTKDGPYDGDRVLDLIKWLTELLDNKVPAAYRDRVKLEIDTSPNYDSYTTTAIFFYDRPETVEEEAQRKQNERVRVEGEIQWARQRLAAAQQALERLK